MKIGDKVRFLSETGGGRISGFQGKNIVLVEDEDGFEIPTLVSEVIVVADSSETEKQIAKAEKQQQASSQPDNRSIKQRLADNENDEYDDTPDDPSVNFTPPVKEREEGELLSIYVGFVPIDEKQITQTKFEAYLINDSNYFIAYNYLFKNGEEWQAESSGEIEPNTKFLLNEFSHTDLNSMLNIAVQLIAYKRKKTFKIKPAIDSRFKLDATKFYKQNSFRENDFFEHSAIIYPIVEADKIIHQFEINADAIKESMLTTLKPEPAKPQTAPARKANTTRQEKRYPSEQSKSAKVKQILRDDKVVIDLHIEQLLETTVGMNSTDILEYQLDVFRSTLEQYKNKPGQKLIFIHGKGEGVLRHALIHELNYKYKHFRYQDASFREYGYGATQVTIRN